MKAPSKIVRFGFSMIAILLLVGLIYAGAESPESELAALVSQLGMTLPG